MPNPSYSKQGDRLLPGRFNETQNRADGMKSCEHWNLVRYPEAVCLYPGWWPPRHAAL
jgi:hypothetical protein